MEFRYDILTRFNDLDSQSHVNSAFYEVYSSEAQFYILSKFGYSFQALLQKGLSVRPQYAQIQFIQQQLPQKKLFISTNFGFENKNLIWEHTFFDDEEKKICIHHVVNSIVNKENNFVIPEDLKPKKIEIFPISSFSNNCKQSLMEHTIRHIDLDGFRNVSTINVWRLNEEARWLFFKEVNLPFQTLFEQNYSFFWIDGIYKYYDFPKLDEEIKINSWIEKIKGARILIRQDALNKENHKLLYSTLSEFVTVDLARLRAVRIPDYFKESFIHYTEYKL